MQSVTYTGSENRSPLTAREAYEVEHKGETYRFEEGIAKDVPNEVAALLKGDSVKGHNFTIGKAE